MVRKSQITLVIGIGIVIILSFIFIILLNQAKLEQISDPSIQINKGKNLFPIDKYIEQCLIQETEPLVKEISKNGGSFNLTYDSIY